MKRSLGALASFFHDDERGETRVVPSRRSIDRSRLGDPSAINKRDTKRRNNSLLIFPSAMNARGRYARDENYPYGLVLSLSLSLDKLLASSGCFFFFPSS